MERLAAPGDRKGAPTPSSPPWPPLTCLSDRAGPHFHTWWGASLPHLARNASWGVRGGEDGIYGEKCGVFVKLLNCLF